MEFERLVNAHKDAVYRQMVRMCGNREDAEDALGEALLRAFRAMTDLRDQDSFQAWFAMIARRVCVRLKNRQKLLQTFQLDDLIAEGKEPAAPLDSPEANLDEERMRGCVKQALESLPEPYRSAYWMRDIEGLSGEEAADQLGVSLPALKSRLHRARRLVRETLDLGMCGPQ